MIKKKKVKSIPKLKAECLALLAELVKLEAERDGKMFCYTCDAPLKNHTTNCQLGHYLARGPYPALTFFRNNVRLQCMPCNVWKHGNTIEFRERLINEIGLEAVQMMENNRHQSVKFDRTELNEMIIRFKAEIKELQNG